MQDIQAMRRQLLKKAKGQVKEEYSKRDVHIIRAVNLLDDLDSAFNLLSGQIKEWYAFHFPELGEIVRDNEKYLMFVYEIGERPEFSKSGAEEKMKGFYDNEEAIKR
ncbi:hypothetical protein KKH30_04080, partial [Candidatus Micrarchaeota archaeon]|nr:hypothetical protein [Candidatus Micrarchaeota archaeon]MBU1939918.1 hypothetical protein [Candidatus Micrarchaeota archaeon]